MAKQITLEKNQSLAFEADRALELIARSIRMAGYLNNQSFLDRKRKAQSENDFIRVQKIMDIEDQIP